MFKDALKEIVEQTDGSMAGLIMDMSGIPLETYSKDDAFDVSTVGAELSVVLGQVQRAGDNLAAGAMRELSVGNEKVVTLIRMLNSTYFLAVTMKPEGNLGRGRYMMRVSAPKILKEL